MKRIVLLLSAALAISGPAGAAPTQGLSPLAQPRLGRRVVPLLHRDGVVFKDMNCNGRLDPYEDWRLPPDRRAADLLQQMSLEQKAGLLVHPFAPSKGDVVAPSSLDFDALTVLVVRDHLRYLLDGVVARPSLMAAMNNRAQQLAEAQPLAIPITFSTDPRNTFDTVLGQNVTAGQFSRWPDAAGIAATGDPQLARRLGAVVAQEYAAVGIRMALSPMADLATEPRWSRMGDTFGTDPDAVGRFVAAYVEGIQGGDKGPTAKGVAAVVKHWVGYGAEPEGFDAHNFYGRHLALSNATFADHIRAFEPALRAGVAGVMTTYGMAPETLIIDGKPAEPVGASFSRQMVEGLLRGHEGYDGIVVTDFLVTHDCQDDCQTGTFDIERVGMPWGVENLPEAERMARALDAGVDQLGGALNSAAIVALVKGKRITEQRIDRSVLRLLTQKFTMGEFENPYVDPVAADRNVGATASKAASLDAQRRSLVLLRNDRGTLPLKGQGGHPLKVWLWGLSADDARRHGFAVAATPDDADVAILHVSTPAAHRPGSLFGSLMREGSLSYGSDNKDRQAVDRATATGRPVVVIARLERAAVLTAIDAKASALMVDFGATDAALFDGLAGRSPIRGHLPYELPRSDAAVEAQAPNQADDSRDPLYPRGSGMTLEAPPSR